MATKTTKPKAKLAKSKKPTAAKITYTMGSNAPTEQMSMESMSNSIRQNMGFDAVSKPEPLQKAVKPVTIEKDVEGKYTQSKIVFANTQYGSNPDNVQQKTYNRLKDSELRQLSLLDPYVSAIITNRCSQAGTTGNPSDSKFDKGMRIKELKPLKRDDFENDEDYDREVAARAAQMEAIQRWILLCGTHDKDIINYAFLGADPTFKYCTLKEFLEAQVRNLLTFGRCGTQIFRNADGIPVMFRPVAIETISMAEPYQSINIGFSELTTKPSAEDLKAYNELPQEERPVAWVQKVDGRNVNFFTEDDLHVWYYQKQALFDLNGYPLAPLEMALFMAYIHQQTLSYLRNQFMKGIASKGMIVLKSTSPDIQISDADLEDFRQQFHNFVTRTDNSAVTPVIGGPIEAQFVALNQTPRDMEWLQVEEHVIRALCSAFQISPQEMGYGHLSLPEHGSAGAGNKQEDIIRGEERGLRMLLDSVFDGLNAIMFENFPEARDLYKITYVGIGEDTRDAVISRQTAELQTTATMSSLYADSEKTETIPVGGNVPLAPAFHANVLRYLKYGVVMEKFFGEEGAEKRPEYDFIVDPQLNAAYQQLKVQPVQMQQEAVKMQLAAQEQQMQLQQQQGEQAQQQAEQQAQQQQMAPGQAPQPGQPAAGSQEQPSEVAPSEGEALQQSERKPLTLMEKYRNLSSEPLEKSARGYFRAWIDTNK